MADEDFDKLFSMNNKELENFDFDDEKLFSDLDNEIALDTGQEKLSNKNKPKNEQKSDFGTTDSDLGIENAEKPVENTQTLDFGSNPQKKPAMKDTQTKIDDGFGELDDGLEGLLEQAQNSSDEGFDSELETVFASDDDDNKTNDADTGGFDDDFQSMFDDDSNSSAFDSDQDEQIQSTAGGTRSAEDSFDDDLESMLGDDSSSADSDGSGASHDIDTQSNTNDSSGFDDDLEAMFADDSNAETSAETSASQDIDAQSNINDGNSFDDDLDAMFASDTADTDFDLDSTDEVDNDYSATGSANYQAQGDQSEELEDLIEEGGELDLASPDVLQNEDAAFDTAPDIQNVPDVDLTSDNEGESDDLDLDIPEFSIGDLEQISRPMVDAAEQESSDADVDDEYLLDDAVASIEDDTSPPLGATAIDDAEYAEDKPAKDKVAKDDTHADGLGSDLDRDLDIGKLSELDAFLSQSETLTLNNEQLMSKGGFYEDLPSNKTSEADRASSKIRELTKDILSSVTQPVNVEIGSVNLSGKELIELQYGSVILLNRHVGDPVDLVLNGKALGQGEVVVVNGNELGVRVVNVRHSTSEL